MFAYVFWHRPQRGIDRTSYEEAQRAFHGALEVTSACFRLAKLPFGEGDSGYEDWATVWQRQMVLGPGPEFCAVSPESVGREKIWPNGS
jgi:hypothetical protein